MINLTLDTTITIRDLVDGYVNNDEEGIWCYGGRLNIRPPYQRNFCYDEYKMTKVIATICAGLSLGMMHWAVNNEDAENEEDYQYEIIDGQQRTLSICKYISGEFTNVRFSKEDLKNFPELNTYNGVSFDELLPEEQEKILDYTIIVSKIKSNDTETKLAWFQRVNIAGEPLTKQELLNATYAGEFIESAKLFFSKEGGPATKYPNFINKDANRQLILEKALEWITTVENKSREADSPEMYLKKHRKDKNANKLITEFNKIIMWAKTTFDGAPIKTTRNRDWGYLYYTYKDKDFSNRDLGKEALTLSKNDEIENKCGIVEYLLSGDRKYLELRQFSSELIDAKFEEQHHKCACCNKVIDRKDAQGDHKVAWSRGGETKYENLQILCGKCNREKGNS